MVRLRLRKSEWTFFRDDERRFCGKGKEGANQSRVCDFVKGGNKEEKGKKLMRDTKERVETRTGEWREGKGGSNFWGGSWWLCGYERKWVWTVAVDFCVRERVCVCGTLIHRVRSAEKKICLCPKRSDVKKNCV